jgi:peptide/nickel transport system substrate-binding protein
MMKAAWFLLLCSLWTIEAEAASATPKRGGTLTLAVSREAVLMHPFVSTGGAEQKVRDLMFESLLGFDAKGKIQPNLAESWTVSDAGRLYTFILRKGVRFHDGRELTSEDVKYAIDYTMNPKNGAYGLNILSPVDKVEADGKQVLKIFLKKANPLFLTSMTEIQAFSAVPKGSLPEGITKLERFPPGTGPFKFVEWQQGQRMVLERNPDYWGHKAFVDRVIIRPIGDGTSRFIALQSGDIDMVEFTPYEWVKQVAEGKIQRIHSVPASYAAFRRLVFNTAAPPFDNKKMRQAVALAIDKRELMHAGFFGFGEPVDQRYPKGNLWHLEGIPPRARDLNKASALLKEAGYRGEAITINAYPGEHEPMAATLQAQLKKVGMNLQIKMLDSAAHRIGLREGNYTVSFTGGNLEADPAVGYGESKHCEPDLKKRRANLSGYCDKEMEHLLGQLEQEHDDAKRRALVKQVLAKHLDDAAEIYVGYAPRFFSMRDYVRGFSTSGDDVYRWWGGGLNHTWLDK